MSNKFANMGSDFAARSDPAGDLPRATASVDFLRKLQADVLSREGFLETLHVEQRRADRSRAPLSLVVTRIAMDGGLDMDDVREIVMDLCLQKRETDIIGYLGEGVVAFLLPYSGAAAAATFSKLIVRRIDASVATVDHAVYADPRFNDLLRQSLARGEGALLFDDEAAEPGRPWTLAVKRIIDIGRAAALVIVLSPLMLVIALAVKFSSPGPVIFRQSRLGRSGAPFTFYKFRSMRMDGDERIHREYVSKLIEGRHDEINEGEAHRPVYKLKADSRITRVGRIIRRTSIDELPQLFNVLKGEMSLVGPRPPIPYEVEKYQSWHLRRLQEVRPGITGLWQVEGRSKSSFDEMVRLDLRYVRHWTLWLDVRILLRTAVVVARREGAD